MGFIMFDIVVDAGPIATASLLVSCSLGLAWLSAGVSHDAGRGLKSPATFGVNVGRRPIPKLVSPSWLALSRVHESGDSESIECEGCRGERGGR
jgi:hypothetical protein